MQGVLAACAGFFVFKIIPEYERYFYSRLFLSMRGIDRASHTKKDGVEDDFFSFQALARNLMRVLFSRGHEGVVF